MNELKTPEALLERVLGSYRVNYDIRLCDETERPLAAECVYHEHATGYLMTRKAEMWAADRHEYVYLFTVSHLTEAVYEQCLRITTERGEPQIKPGKDHMCTALVCMILCDTADDEALKTLKKCRIRKSFHFSLHGWMEVQTAAAILGKDTAVSNTTGTNAAKFLKNVLHPPKKKGQHGLFR